MERLQSAFKKTFFAGLVVVVPIRHHRSIPDLALQFPRRIPESLFETDPGNRVRRVGLLTEIVLIFLVG